MKLRLYWNQHGRQHCQDFLDEMIAQFAADQLRTNFAANGVRVERLADGDRSFDPSGPRCLSEFRGGQYLDTQRWRGMAQSSYTPEGE